MHAGVRQRLNWRNPRVICSACDTFYDIGFHFQSGTGQKPPHNAVFASVPVVWTANTLGSRPPGVPATARAVGVLYWICGCKRLQRSKISLTDAIAACPDCKLCYTVGVILYRTDPHRKRRRTPLDWILPVWDLA